MNDDDAYQYTNRFRRFHGLDHAELAKKDARSSAFTMPAIYRSIGPVTGLPLNWRDEVTGVLPNAVKRYLDNRVEGKSIDEIDLEIVRVFMGALHQRAVLGYRAGRRLSRTPRFEARHPHNSDAGTDGRVDRALFGYRD